MFKIGIENCGDNNGLIIDVSLLEIEKERRLLLTSGPLSSPPYRRDEYGGRVDAKGLREFRF